MRYELHCGGKRVIGSLEDLKKIAKRKKKKYEIYLYIESGAIANNQPNILSCDLPELLRLMKKGYTKTSLVKNFKISFRTLNRFLNANVNA